MPEEQALAIDMSNYTGSVGTVKARNLAKAGVKRAIVQLVNERVYTHDSQIPSLLAADIEVQSYVYLWFSGGPDFMETRMNWACDQLDKYEGKVGFIWLDCEQSDRDDPPFDYVHAPVSPTIRKCIEVATERGYNVGIYTAAWWWIPGASNSTEWSDLPLWNCNYDLDPDLDPVDFGGWTVPRMEQYQGNTTLQDVPYIDLNSYIVQVIKNEQPMPENPPASPEPEPVLPNINIPPIEESKSVSGDSSSKENIIAILIRLILSLFGKKI